MSSGHYHYDEQFPHQNGEAQVRLTLIDSITNLVINDIIFEKEEFDKNLVEAFLESSLEGLPKEAIITDGVPMYVDILEKICVKHQMCIFHIIKNHHDSSFPKINGIKRRINTINNQIPANKTTIESLQNQLRNGNLTKKKKDKKKIQNQKIGTKKIKISEKKEQRKKQNLKNYYSTGNELKTFMMLKIKKEQKKTKYII